MAETMIQASSISKRYGQHTVVDQVSLNIPTATIFGLLGPNAAGKTTVIRMLCGIIKADQGDIRINGQSIDQAKRNFGYVAQYFGQYEELSVWENLQFYASMYDVTDKQWLETLLQRYGLEPYRDQQAGLLSGGYKRRLALVCALSHDPQVLFLDEPTAGIDPVTRKLLWDEFYKLSVQGKTLFVTTHYMEEAQRCQQLAFITAGEIVAQGSPNSIKQALGEVLVYTTALPYLPELQDTLNALPGVILVNQFGDQLRLMVTPALPRQQLEKLISEMSQQAIVLQHNEANLEDVFIALTQDKPAMEKQAQS